MEITEYIKAMTTLNNIEKSKAQSNKSFQIRELEDFNPSTRIMSADIYHMGTTFGENAMALYKNHSDERMNYIILADQPTGKRIQIIFPKDRHNRK